VCGYHTKIKNKKIKRHTEGDTTRVPGLPIRNCADISNNSVQRGAQVSAIDVTESVSFERLYLVSGLGTFGP